MRGQAIPSKTSQRRWKRPRTLHHTHEFLTEPRGIMRVIMPNNIIHTGIVPIVPFVILPHPGCNTKVGTPLGSFALGLVGAYRRPAMTLAL